MAKPRQTVARIRVPFATLRALLGRPVDDAEVTTALAGAGKVKVTSEHVIARDGGFDFALAAPANAKRGTKKRLATLFLYPEGGNEHRQFADLPAPFSFTTRADLLAALPSPARTWRADAGDVPASTPDDEVTGDTWINDGFEFSACYREGAVRYITVTPTVAAADDTQVGASLATFPLQHVSRPADAAPDAELTAMALLVAWAVDRFGLPPKHAATPLGDELVGHAITPRAFLIDACNRTLTTLDFVPQLADFLGVYTGTAPMIEHASRAAASARIKELLHLPGDGQLYADDYLGTFALLESPYYVPDAWEAVARIQPVIDARLADYEATKFRRRPRMSLYEKAAEARDMWTVAPARG
jgi:hypothetical protein